MIRRFEHTEISFEKDEKFRKFDSKRVKKNFIYRFFNVKINDDDVQNAIDRNEYKSRSRNREYRENRRRADKISRQKIKEFKNNNFIDFSKINYFKCRQNEHYVCDCIVFAFANESRKKNLINVVSIASTQIVNNKSALHHFLL